MKAHEVEAIVEEILKAKQRLGYLTDDEEELGTEAFYLKSLSFAELRNECQIYAPHAL